MTEGISVQKHVLMVIDLITRLAQLGFVMDGEFDARHVGKPSSRGSVVVGRPVAI